MGARPWKTPPFRSHYWCSSSNITLECRCSPSSNRQVILSLINDPACFSQLGVFLVGVRLVGSGDESHVERITEMLRRGWVGFDARLLFTNILAADSFNDGSRGEDETV